MTATADQMARGWCPGVRRPMESGDGLIVRVHPRNGTLTRDQVSGVADAASRFGNGILDITSHANLQIRGAREATRAPLEAELDRLGLVEASPRPPYRATVISPLTGDDPNEIVDARPLADMVEAAVAEMTLPAKFLIAIETGGASALDHLAPDLRIDADQPDTVSIALARPDGRCWGAPMALDDLEPTLRRLLSALSTALADHAVRRVRALPTETIEALLSPPSAPHRMPLPPLPAAGIVSLKDGYVGLLAAAPFGQLSSDQLAAVATSADKAGVPRIRLTPARGIFLPGLSEATATDLVPALSDLGLVTAPNDKRLRVVTCPGAPACSRALTPTRSRAARLAEHLPDGPWPALVHLSGCAKGCARRKAAPLTLVAADTGFDVVLDGGPFDVPVANLDFDDILHRLAAPGDEANLRTRFGGRTARCATTT
ncbi:precorrin-3B synthase [Amorphus sp. 3PC139-8]|uniref:precorrin-3B synthase n=1 Tax=Amorphus sp. 3PC139-8 TaxID=2735676 RepID=UPI00345DFD91